eukprot:gene24940-45855_t
MEANYCMLGIDWWALCLMKSEWAGWVQALGSVTALFVTGGLVVWEVRQRRLDQNRAVADRLLARVTLLDAAASQVNIYLEVHRGDDRKRMVVPKPQHSSAALYMLNAALKLDFDEMPTEAAVRQLAVALSALLTMQNALEKLKGVWLQPDEIRHFEVRVETVRESLQKIRSEA